MTMIKKYKKKPVVELVEAIKFIGDSENIEALCDFIEDGCSYEPKNNVLIFSGNEYEYRPRIAHVGDYIIKTSKGEFDSCSSDDFEMAYGEIEND